MEFHHHARAYWAVARWSSCAELAQDLKRVESLPPAFAGLCREILVELDEQIDEFAAHRRSTKQCGQLGQIDEPVRIPGCPIRIISVDDAVHTVVRLCSLGQKLANPGLGVVLC